MLHSQLKKIAYYSSVECAPTFGGPLQIHRHFRERNDYEFIDLNPACATPWDAWLPSAVVQSCIFKRLCNTRLYPWIIYSSHYTHLRRQARHLARQLREVRADALVTVAYGRRCNVALVAAKIAKIPLITIFHDWWPDLVYGKNSYTLAAMDRRFRELGANSDLVFAVSQQLLDELGVKERCVVLPPIPAERIAGGASDGLSSKQAAKKLVYAGTLQGPYGVMVRDLAMYLIKNPQQRWTLRVYGPAMDWATDVREAFSANGIYGGTLPQGPELVSSLETADALLVVMDFELRNRRRVVTSFPSKILDYAQIGKPLVTWGPEQCFAVQFSRKHKLGFHWMSPDAEGLIRALDLNWSDEARENASNSVRTLANGDYSAGSIHQILKRSLSRIL